MPADPKSRIPGFKHKERVWGWSRNLSKSDGETQPITSHDPENMSKNVADLRSAVAVHKLLKETEDHWTGVIPYTRGPFEDITCHRDKIPHAREWLSRATINAVAGLELSSKYGLPMANSTEWVLSADLKDRLGKKYTIFQSLPKVCPIPKMSGTSWAFHAGLRTRCPGQRWMARGS